MADDGFGVMVDRLLAVLATTHGAPRDELLSRQAARRDEGHASEVSVELTVWASFCATWQDHGHIAPALTAPTPEELGDLDEWLKEDPIEDRHQLLRPARQPPDHHDFQPIAKYLNGTAVVVTPTAFGETPRVLTIGEFEAGLWLPAIDAVGSRAAERHEDLPTLEAWVRSLVAAHEGGKFIAAHQPGMKGLGIAGQADTAGPPGIWHTFPFDE